MAGAAIFDLDRTVIPGSFVLGTFGAAVDDRSLLGVALRMATGWFEQRGESRTSAVLSRTALNMLTPLAPSRLRTLGERAAVRVEPFEWVNGALERHRAAGETTVLTS
ncbi:MAG: hypothetical protein IH940_03090, partial [Acidobacteria bacterium]|nr:hypothetical protein [Acidobacteriota bacterium]